MPGVRRPGGSHCEAHRSREQRGGTTSAWSKARQVALDRAGWKCESCGRSQAEAKAESRDGKGLHVHHRDGQGSFRDGEHDQAKLEVRCPPCHNKVRAKKTRPTREQWQESIKERARLRRRLP